jgi:hypothetical protein
VEYWNHDEFNQGENHGSISQKTTGHPGVPTVAERLQFSREKSDESVD